MKRITADERVRRLLSLIPLVAARRDGVPIDELCTRFEIDRRTLVDDLTTMSFVGVAPYTPDTQVDVVVEDGRVFVHLPQWFDRPLKLTPEQGLALVAAGQSFLSVQGADPGGPLARAIDKLAATLGVRAGEAIDVRFAGSATATVALLRQAIEEHRRVRLAYYTYGRDEHTERTVEPYRLHGERGQLYLWAHCRDSGGERAFRLDRIDEAVLLDETFVPAPHGDATPVLFQPGPDVPRITLDLTPAARWVAEHYPIDHAVEQDNGVLRVTLAVTAHAWLERLLLRLGPDARIVQADGDHATAGRDAARRVLDRYRSSTPRGI